MSSRDWSLLSSLGFTKSAGKANRTENDAFSDATTVGGFPVKQDITKLISIRVFMSDGDSTAVISGLRVTYRMEDGSSRQVDHGLTANKPVAGTLMIGDQQFLVGASGRFKQSADANKDGRISFIDFVVYNKGDGETTITKLGNDQSVKGSWGSYGPIIALEGTTSQTYGLTTLGFARIGQGVKEYNISSEI